MNDYTTVTLRIPRAVAPDFALALKLHAETLSRERERLMQATAFVCPQASEIMDAIHELRHAAQEFQAAGEVPALDLCAVVCAACESEIA